jgi:DGQHR domain-containing protein
MKIKQQSLLLHDAKEESDQLAEGESRLRYSVSLVSQGKHRFYTLTMPSDALARTCYATTREEDPQAGFQRVLDKERAQQIADYIDLGFGTIPNSIVLSAQPETDLEYDNKRKTISFKANRKAFLILDGQHRVYGFSLAKTKLRVPVVIYNGLSKRDESRLFIDINTKQRPVPSELLLDIKKLAEYETDAEKLFSEIFDAFDSEPESPLLGLLSPSSKEKGKITRVTFNAAMKPLLPAFEDTDSGQVYSALQSYIRAFMEGCEKVADRIVVTNPTVFRAALQLFPEVGAKVKDRFHSEFTTDNFSKVLEPVFEKIKGSDLTKPPRSHLDLHNLLSRALRQSFTLK